MPLDPITSAIVSSIISSVVEGILTPAPEEPAMGIIRTLPAESLYGEMLPPQDGQVRIGGKTYPLSPGAVVRNEFNMMIPPMMVQAPVKVRFMTETTGFVHRIWILSSAEAQLASQSP
jgi:hypothetical protein